MDRIRDARPYDAPATGGLALLVDAPADTTGESREALALPRVVDLDAEALELARALAYIQSLPARYPNE